MKICEVLHKEAILPDLKARNKKGILEELVAPVAEIADVHQEDLVKVLLEREHLGSTGIGNGIAIPHGKLDGLDSIALVFGKKSAGVDFDSIDGKPVSLIFLLVAPAQSAGVHLKALARLSRLLKDKSFRQQLLEGADASGIYQTIVTEDEKTAG